MQIMWIVKKDTGIDFQLLVLGMCVGLAGLVATTDLKSTTEKKPYFCLGTDVCNKVGKWQWCDEDGEMRCRDCSEKENFCGTLGMPKNCSTFCSERELEREKGKGCQPLEKIRHGHHNGTNAGTKHGAAIELQCKPGYHCQGQCTTTCGDYGQYTHSLSCTENRCPALPFLTDGKYSPERSTYEVNDTINFICEDGFILVGSHTAKCTNNGTWNIKQYPTCVQNEKGIRIEYWHGILAVCIALLVGMIAGCCIHAVWKCYSRKKKYQKHVKETNSDTQDQGDETRLLSTGTTGEKTFLKIEDESVQYAKPKLGQSEPSLFPGHRTSGEGFGYNSISENNIPSQAGQGTDSGVSTSNPSKDSGLHVTWEPSKVKSPPIHLTLNINNSNTNTNHQSNTVPDRSGQPKDEESKPAENIPRTAVVDKYPTEETRDSKNECRGEFQDNVVNDVDEAGGEEEEGVTNVKERACVKEKDRDHVPGFPVQEQEKSPPDTGNKFHNQQVDSGTKAGKMAIGSNTMDQADIKGHVN